MLTRYNGQLKLKEWPSRSPSGQRCAKRKSLWRAALGSSCARCCETEPSSHRHKPAEFARQEPIGDDATRSPVFLHDPLKKLQRCGFVSLRGDHSLQDLALMVDCAPQIAELTVDLHEHLIQVPAPLRDTRACLRRVAYESPRANIGPNRFHQNRTVSWLMSIPRSANRSSTLRSDNGYRTYIITTRRMTSGELLKYRKGLLMRRG